MSPAARPLIHPRDELVALMERIYHYRMTTTSGGNLSVRDDDGAIWITPARVDKGSLRAGDIVRIRADGQVDGAHPPSSEHPFHQAIYRARPDIQAIVHAHPVALVAFSICRQVPNTLLFPQAQHVCGQVGYAPYALPGSARLGENIAAVFAQGHHCVLLENHGVVIGASSLAEAFQRFETLEFTARTIIRASRLGSIRYLSEAQIDKAQQRGASLPEFAPGRASTREKELRQQIASFVRRGYRQRLMTSTEGSFSARLDADSFLITPYGIDRHALAVDDVVLVRAGKREAGKQPSRAHRLHGAVYERHGDLQSIVNAIPVNATAFSVTGQLLDARTIPESYLFLRDVNLVPFGPQYDAPASIADIVSLQAPVALIENDGALVLGTSVLDAFDRLEVLESTAEAVIDAGAVGSLNRMDDATIAELIAAFARPSRAGG